MNVLSIGPYYTSNEFLVAYWNFDNTLNSNRSGVNAGDLQTLELSNGSQMSYFSGSDCVVGGCVQSFMTDTSIYLKHVDVDADFRQNTSYSWFAWVKSDFLISDRTYMFSSGTGYGTGFLLAIFKTFADGDKTGGYTPLNAWFPANSTAGVANAWDSFAFVFNAETQTGTVYYNGLPYGSTPGAYGSSVVNETIQLCRWDVATNSNTWFDEYSIWNTSLTAEDVANLNNSKGVLDFQPPNTPADLDINSPDNDTIFNTSPIEFIFNVSDTDLNDIDCHLFGNSEPYDSIYNVSYTANQSLNATITTNNEYIFSLICDDGTTNTTKYITIIYDTENPTIAISNPYQNNSYYENDFYYNISINDTNLYSSNTTIYCNNNPYYENVTQDYNISQIDLIDLISITAYGNNSCDLCSTICDGHTDNILSTNFKYELKQKTLIIKNEQIKFIGTNIQNIKINRLQDRITFDLTLTNTNDIIIELPECFKKVSKTQNKNHYVCLEKRLWFDTNPFETTLAYEENEKIRLVLTPQNTIMKFNSIGELNCVNECRLFNIDTDYPYITAQSPKENDYYNTPLNLSFTFIVTDSTNIANCSLYLNDTLNYTIEGIMKDINQSLYVYFNTEPNNESYYYNISCSDYNTHIGFFENINFNINWLNTSIPPIEPMNETITSTYEAIDKFGKWVVTLILIIIWALFLLISFILGGNWFILMTGFLGIGIGIYHNFNGLEIMQFLFIAFNLMIMAYAIFYHNNGLLTK